MYKEATIPVTWEGWNEVDINVITIYRVNFLEDFGIFKKGEYYTSLNVNYAEGFIEYWENEFTQKIQYFKAQPIDKVKK